MGAKVKMVDELQLGFSISKIQTIKFSYEEISDETLEDLLNRKDALAVNMELTIKIEKDLTSLRLDVESEFLDIEANNALVKHTGRTTYLMRGLEYAFNKKNDVYDLPDDILVQLYGLAYTHARALLASEISRTNYREKYFLPILDPATFLQK